MLKPTFESIFIFSRNQQIQIILGKWLMLHYLLVGKKKKITWEGKTKSLKYLTKNSLRTYYVDHNNRTTQWNRPSGPASGAVGALAAHVSQDSAVAEGDTLNRQISHTEDNSFMNRRNVSGKLQTSSIDFLFEIFQNSTTRWFQQQII